jgi:hypothetical protein
VGEACEVLGAGLEEEAKYDGVFARTWCHDVFYLASLTKQRRMREFVSCSP